MKTARRISVLCLSLLLLFSFMFSSCKKDDESPPTVTYITREVELQLDYKEASFGAWRKGEWAKTVVTITDGEDPSNEITVPWTPDLDPSIKPNSTVINENVTTYSNTLVSHAVYNFLSVGRTTEMQFLIQPYDRDALLEYRDYYKSWWKRDELLNQWSEEYLLHGEVVEKTGFVLWTGTAEELLAIAERGTSILVCFPSDFQSIFGMSVEKAQEMIDAGELDMWCCPVEGSPLRDKTGAEIAEYLAKQEQE